MKYVFAVASGLMLASTAAQAVTITSADLLPNANNTTNSILIDGVTFKSYGGLFDNKTVAGYLGIGVGSGTAGEINLGEAVRALWTGQQEVTSITLSALFNGPEWGDVNEVAKVKLLGSGIYGTLTATGDTQATWQLYSSSNVALGAAVLIDAVSPATQDGAGVWTINDPFAGYVGKGLKFTALPGVCGFGNSCYDQSDYSLFSLSISPAVPEPSSYALFGAGLAAMGGLLVARRNRGN